MWGGLALMLLFSTGLIAGLWSAARTPLQTAGIGALAGWFAAWTAEASLGSVLAGLWSARSLLAHGLAPAENEARFVALIADSVWSIVVWVNASIAFSALVGIVTGGFGGLLGGLLFGKRSLARRSSPDPAFSLRLSALMTLSASLAMVVTVTVYPLLLSSTQNAVTQNAASLPGRPALIFETPVAIGLLWWLFWVAMTWNALRRTPPGMRVGGSAGLAGFVCGATYLGVWWSVLGGPFGGRLSGFADWAIAILLTAVLTLFFLLTGLIIQKIVPAGIRAFLRRQGSPRRIAWMLLGLSLLTFLSVFGAHPEDGWHTLWLPGGLLFGVLLGLDALRRTRPLESGEEPLSETPNPLGTVFAVSFLTQLALLLTSAAPLALVLLPIVMIAYLQPGGAAPEPAKSLADIIAEYVAVPLALSVYLLTLGTVFISLTSAGLRWVWRQVTAG
ncbi:MAG: hypothetical protein RMJ85_16100 [Anaerolineales bacterium]|nr:hypothetical protein [Anaerolineales bacterium]